MMALPWRPQPKERFIMQYVKFNADAELRKFLKGKETKVDLAVLLNVIGHRYLEALKSR
jgi:hypothetical protein